MPWVRLDDQFTEHRKYHGSGNLSPLLLALQVAALCYCARHLTDGFMTTAQAKALALQWTEGITVADDNGHALDMTPAIMLQAMVDAGLWDKVPRGYAIHDYAHFQPTREQVEQQRAGTRERVRAYRSRNSVTGDVTPDVSNGRTAGYRVPGNGYRGTGTTDEVVPTDGGDSVPNFWQPGNEGTDDPFVALHGMTGRVPTGRGAEWLNEMARDHGDRAVTTELARQWGDDPNERTLLKRTHEALKLAAVLKNRAKPQAPQPEPPKPSTPEERWQAAVQRRAVRLWLEAGGPGSGKTAEQFVEQAEKEVPRARTDAD